MAPVKKSKKAAAAAPPAAAPAVVETPKKPSTIAPPPSTGAESSPIDKEQVLKAARALSSFLAKEKGKDESTAAKPNLLGDDGETVGSHGIYGSESIWVIITAKKYLSDKKQLMPVRISVPNPLLSASNTSALLITKDPQRAYKDLLLPHSQTVQKVVGLSKLRSKHKTFEQLRQLRDTHDLILADDRIVTSLRNTVGSTFLKQSTKIPIPVKISGKDNNTMPTLASVEKQIQKAVEAVYVHIPAANSINIRAGLEKQTPEQVVENIMQITQTAIGDKKVVKGGWNAVKSIYIKSSNSISLPVFVNEQMFDPTKDVETVEEREQQKKAAEEKKKLKDAKKREKKAKQGIQGVAVEKKRKAEDDLSKEKASEATAKPVVVEAAAKAVEELTLEKSKKRKVVAEEKKVEEPVKEKKAPKAQEKPVVAAEKKQKARKAKQ